VKVRKQGLFPAFLLKKMVSAIIVAAGKGKRFGGALKKQFIEIEGKPVLFYSVESFFLSKSIDEIILVVPREDRDYVKEKIHKFHINKKVKSIVEGGNRRQDSVYKGLSEVSPGTQYVLIHDGARPLIRVNQIDEIVREVRKSKAVVLAVPVRDTIIEEEQNYIMGFVDRRKLRMVQTPQAFEIDLIKNAYEKAFQDKFYGTDDSSLVERSGDKVKVVPGDYTNIKMTTKEDLSLIHSLMKKI